MCVIIVAKDERPTPEMIGKAFTANDDGGGMAWREPAEDGKGTEVVWRKGLDEDEMQRLAAEMPLPYVLHFRINSCGQQANKPNLTHPFPIDESGVNYLSGRTKGHVLFHNGHWKDWQKVVLDTAIRFGKPIPDGKFTDTRAIAWLMSLYGRNFMEFIGEKGVAFGPRSMELFWGSGWSKIDSFWVSNTIFTRKGYYNPSDPTGAYSGGGSNPTTPNTRYFICRVGNCNETQGLNQTTGYCHLHDDLATSRLATAKKHENSVQIITPKPTIDLPNEEVELKGVAQSETPFDNWRKAKENFEKGLISHRALKRARRAMEKAVAKAAAQDKKNRAVHLPSERSFIH